MIDTEGLRIILGSNSPRRREILSGLDIPFTLDSKTSFEESVPDGVAHEDIPLLMAEGKSAYFHRPLEEDEILITADTMVLLKDGPIIGKPKDRADAIRILGTLAGKTHTVITAVVIRDRHRKVSFTDSTDVVFGRISEEEAQYYIDKYKPFDKAGSYAVQEWIGHVGIERIDGSYFNVMGLPAHRLYRELEDFIALKRENTR